jgi:hypothetical protein
MDNHHGQNPLRFASGFYTFLYSSLISAHFLVSVGGEKNFFELVLDREYFLSLFLVSVACLAVALYVSWIDRNLNTYYEWDETFPTRIFYQFALCLALPCFMVYVTVAFIHYIAGTDFNASLFLNLKMPIIFLLLLVLNLLLIISHLVTELSGKMDPIGKKQLVWVHKSGRNIPLDYSEIAYIYHKDNYNYLRTFSNEDFLISQSLDWMQQKLPSTDFFRANRQVIIHISSCTHYQTLPFGKLLVETSPAFDSEIIVSQKRAKDFRKWAGKP